MSKSILVTGAAGFIGAAITEKLLKSGEKVIGIDNLNSYYDKRLKLARLSNIEDLAKDKDWVFHELSIEDKDYLFSVLENDPPNIIINLAAQAGVRYSLENPSTYIQSNIVGFGNILEVCREMKVEHLIYASSSSVYGGNKKLPFNEKQPVNHPVSLYAASKKANELMAHSYSHLFNIPSTGLRFFTVYGPWGRPDMAPMIFAKAILNEEPIRVFNYGRMERDFTYIDDVVEGIFRCCYKPATKNINFNDYDPDPATANAPHRLFNIGNSTPTNLLDFIEIIEKVFNKKAVKNYDSIQPGDVIATAADTSALNDWIGFKPSTKLEEGVKQFANWYESFYSNLIN